MLSTNNMVGPFHKSMILLLSGRATICPVPKRSFLECDNLARLAAAFAPGLPAPAKQIPNPARHGKLLISPMASRRPATKPSLFTRNYAPRRRFNAFFLLKCQVRLATIPGHPALTRV
jgi:hypothetical protein